MRAASGFGTKRTCAKNRNIPSAPKQLLPAYAKPVADIDLPRHARNQAPYLTPGTINWIDGVRFSAKSNCAVLVRF